MTSHRASPAVPITVTAVGDGAAASSAFAGRKHDQVVGEEPLEIRVEGPGVPAVPVAVTMRTPGHDFELAAGFLVGEGIVGKGKAGIRSVRYCELPPGDPQMYNVVTVTLDQTPELGDRQRKGTVTSACGVCGTATIDLLYQQCEPFPSGLTVDTAVLVGFPDALRRAQKLFDRTGGLHGAGLFGADGRVLAVREDIGRHNAVDKLAGWAALSKRLPLSDGVLVVSGRVSFEIVQKAAVAGIPVVVAVSAPSSLAVDTARRFNMTLAAFVRNGRANLYAGEDRVVAAGP